MLTGDLGGNSGGGGTLKSYYEAFIRGNESVFSDFELGGDIVWKDDNALFLNDIDFSNRKSGYLNIKFSDSFTGKITLELMNENNLWFEENGFKTVEKNIIRPIFTGGDYLTIDVDKDFGGQRFSFKIDSQNIKGTSQVKINDEVEVRLIN